MNHPSAPEPQIYASNEIPRSQTSPKMEENRMDAGNRPAENSAAETPEKPSDALPEEPSSSRRRGGGQQRKAHSLTPHTASSSKRQAREKPSVVPFLQIHKGPCTRARQAGTSDSRALKVEEELSAAREDYEALEAKIEAEYEVIRSRDANAFITLIVSHLSPDSALQPFVCALFDTMRYIN